MSEATADGQALLPTYIGGGAALVSLGALAYVTILLFDRPALGLVVGALSAAGNYLLVPYMVRREAEEYEPESDPNLERSFHRGAAGYALSSSGVVVIALMFVFEDPVVSVLVAVAVALAEYVAFSRVLPRAGE